MIAYQKRLDRAFQSAPLLTINDDSRIVIMSDCHRGVGNLADDFGYNQSICYAALKTYNRLNYTYIELGDGDELWENKCMPDIESVHGDIFRILKDFYLAGRLWMLYGNHDMEKKFHSTLPVLSNDAKTKKQATVFPGLIVYESLRIKYEPLGGDILLLHGHQVDFLNYTLWRLPRFLVRHIWQRLEHIGFSNPTSAAKNNKIKRKVESRLTQWAAEKNLPVISGHTHRPIFPEPSEGKYFNDGCCVHPWNVTAIEIEAGAISLVKWRQMTRDNGTVYIGKDVIAGPKRLTEYFQAHIPRIHRSDTGRYPYCC